MPFRWARNLVLSLLIVMWAHTRTSAHRARLRFAIPLHGFTSQYVAEIQVGTPPQKFEVLWDTGSCNTWVFSRECETFTCQRHRRFDYSRSSTYTENGTELTVKYGSGEIDSVLARDDFRVGPMVVRQQDFAEVYATRGSVFLTGIIDGIVGLAFPKMSVASIRPIFDSMMQQNLLQSRHAFAMYLSRQLDGNRSVLLFGNEAIDGHDNSEGATLGEAEAAEHPSPSLFWPPIQYVAVHSTLYWEVAIVGISVGNERLGLCSSRSPCRAAVDTGTSLITAPSAHVRELHRHLRVGGDSNGDGDDAPDHHRCRWSDLPSIVFSLAGGLNLTLHPSDYILRARPAGRQELCFAAVMPMDVPPPRGPLWVFGDLFLRAYYTVFDRGLNGESDPRLGFARARHATVPAQTDDARAAAEAGAGASGLLGAAIVHEEPEPLFLPPWATPSMGQLRAMQSPSPNDLQNNLRALFRRQVARRQVLQP